MFDHGMFSNNGMRNFLQEVVEQCKLNTYFYSNMLKQAKLNILKKHLRTYETDGIDTLRVLEPNDDGGPLDVSRADIEAMIEDLSDEDGSGDTSGG